VLARVQVAVVGGGVIGLACAAELALHGHLVTVYDAAPEAREASWAAAGMLAPHHECREDGPLYTLVRAGLDAYPAFFQRHGITPDAVDLRQDGSWIPVLDDRDAHDVAQRVNFLKLNGVPTQWCDASALLAQEPGFARAIRGALLVPGGQVNPRLLTAALQARCHELGVQVQYRRRVQTLTEAGPIIDGEVHPAATTVLASGAWTPALAAISGMALEGEPVKGQLLRFACADGALQRFVHCRHAYLVPRRGDGVVVGATMVWDGFDKREDAAAIAELAASARRLLPTLENSPIAETWTGLRPRLHTGLPCIAKARPNLIIATGHFRNGILLAPLTATCVAALVDGRETPLDLSPFNVPNRPASCVLRPASSTEVPNRPASCVLRPASSTGITNPKSGS